MFIVAIIVSAVIIKLFVAAELVVLVGVFFIKLCIEQGLIQVSIDV
jgi:hypothetical protein